MGAARTGRVVAFRTDAAGGFSCGDYVSADQQPPRGCQGQGAPRGKGGVREGVPRRTGGWQPRRVGRGGGCCSVALRRAATSGETRFPPTNSREPTHRKGGSPSTREGGWGWLPIYRRGSTHGGDAVGFGLRGSVPVVLGVLALPVGRGEGRGAWAVGRGCVGGRSRLRGGGDGMTVKDEPCAPVSGRPTWVRPPCARGLPGVSRASPA